MINLSNLQIAEKERESVRIIAVGEKYSAEEIASEINDAMMRVFASGGKVLAMEILTAQSGGPDVYVNGSYTSNAVYAAFLCITSAISDPNLCLCDDCEAKTAPLR